MSLTSTSGAELRTWLKACTTEMGRGEIDFDEVFAALASVGFHGLISSCVFGWEEYAAEISVRQREKATALIDKHVGRGSPETGRH
ncbi:hypothetical protein [Streptomyces panaciradicis]|uniref:hypothetical protein n=1 Tax=Streptomyces panaciradicis TaxID=1470261 RepID=UPI00201CE18F|nr:hypothetical protein [Streptomyces panaciradicis]MCL6672219.1 hypothetical protein [Streptomyces panaciradicis]